MSLQSHLHLSLAQVDATQSENVSKWSWAEADLDLLLDHLKALHVVHKYRCTHQRLIVLGAEGQENYARVQMRLLRMVMKDFAAQLHSLEEGSSDQAPNHTRRAMGKKSGNIVVFFVFCGNIFDMSCDCTNVFCVDLQVLKAWCVK